MSNPDFDFKPIEIPDDNESNILQPGDPGYDDEEDEEDFVD